MTRNQLAKRICDNLKLKGMENRKLVKDIIAQEEDIVYEAIATEDSVTYVWGKVYGTFRTPKRLGGAPSQSEAAFRNHGWCSCLRGKPAVKWSEAANLCEEQSAKDFFEEEGHRYTTLARIFRQENGFEEIPEYQGLSEEEILVKCQMADKIEKETFLPSSIANARLRSSEEGLLNKIAVREYYRRINHTPMGFLYDPKLGDYNWTDEQRTNYDDTMAKIEAIIGNKARAEFLNRTVCMYISSGQYTHAERLFEDFKNFYEAAIAEGNNPEIEIYFYVKRRKKNLKYLGEADAWGLTEQQEKERERFTFLSEYYKRLGLKIVYENGEFAAKDLDYEYDWENDQNFLEEFIVPKRKRKDGINY